MMRSLIPLRWAAVYLAAMLAAPTGTLAQSANGGTSAPNGATSATGQPSPPNGATSDAKAPQTTGTMTAPQTTTTNSLQPPGGATVGHAALVRGRLTPSQAGRTVLLAMSDPRRGWITVGGAKADASGGFVVAWHPKQVGHFLLRASSGNHAAASPTAPVEVYRSVIATFFGPGFYGSRTACGQTLTPELLGVAHRSLPCGSLVDIIYGNRSITVPVVDRGPYANGATYDLTAATARALSVSDTVRIGALPVRGGAPVAP